MTFTLAERIDQVLDVAIAEDGIAKDGIAKDGEQPAAADLPLAS